MSPPASTAPTEEPPPLRVGIDVGGTFTDLAAVVDGELRVAKVPSTPADQSLGVADALRGAALAGPLLLAHGTTAATNALLERRGARTALVTTEGFADVIEIARQTRAHLYDPAARRPAPLVPHELRFTVRERMGPQGVIAPLDPASLEEAVAALATAGVEAVAVCLLFSFLHPEHEQAVGRAIRAALPGVHVSLSSEVLPELREYERTSTTVADAFLGPELVRYLGRLTERVAPLGVAETFVMGSAGGVRTLAEAAARPSSCVLSGPAGGVVGAAEAARRLGLDDVLTLDVGGTSADVAAILGGESVTSSEHTVAGLDVRLPALDIHTISAGGGSIAWIDDGGALRVGPRSAGADPGPACYGRGGQEPTLTDAHLLLGHLEDGARLGEAVTLSRAAAERALARVGERAGLAPDELAAGIVRVADHAIAQALHHITVARGLDPRRFALMAFGGAGGLHACRVAEQLGIGTVVIPAAAGVLSALGLARAALRLDAARSLVAPLDSVDGQLDAAFSELEEQLRAKLPGAQTSRRTDLRYRRQAHELTVPADDLAGLAERFHAAHERRHGYAMREEPVELVTIRAAASVEAPGAAASARWHGPAPGERVTGPAIVAYPDSTCVVPDGWAGAPHESGALVLERAR